MLEELNNLNQRLWQIEEKFAELGYSTQLIVQSETVKKWKTLPQAETMSSLHLAICVGTIDPWKGLAVRYFSPLMHDPDTPFESLPFAHPIATFGGFDDSGSNWVPPAGSTLCLLFESGSRDTAYYIGTIWHRDRGPEGNRKLLANCDEFYKIHEGHRKGYLVGPDDGSQAHPPWNTQTYNGYDIDSITDFTDDPDAQRKITYPHIYGFKTMQKHAVKMNDGNYQCNHKGKAFEIFSSCGGHFLMKDDHIHQSEIHPDCGGGQDSSDCNDEDGKPKEKMECDGETSNSSIMNGHPSTPDGTTYGLNSNSVGNPYYKHANECRPYKGPGTPQNNKVQLPQSGIQILSISGQTLLFDDSVEEPSGIPEWERSLKDFDFGCNDKFLGKIMMVSATGHKFIMSDEEEDTGLRGDKNYIKMLTATGISIELNDHTVGQPDCPGSPPNIAGERRGIFMKSSSNHVLEICDNENEQSSPCRKEGGTPVPKAKRAYIKARTGYGLEFSMNDFDPAGSGTAGSQEKTINQNIQLYCPQKDNEDRGPHIMRFQERPSGPGQVYLRAGGDYICQTYDNHLTVVGDIEKNPANKITSVSGSTIIQTEKFYFNVADLIAMQAKEIILLMAGNDCQNPAAGTDDDQSACSPCVWPVLCLTPKGVTVSDRVYVSASPDASCANIFQMTPFHSCAPFKGCGG